MSCHPDLSWRGKNGYDMRKLLAAPLKVIAILVLTPFQAPAALAETSLNIFQEEPTEGDEADSDKMLGIQTGVEMVGKLAYWSAALDDADPSNASAQAFRGAIQRGLSDGRYKLVLGKRCSGLGIDSAKGFLVGLDHATAALGQIREQVVLLQQSDSTGTSVNAFGMILSLWLTGKHLAHPNAKQCRANIRIQERSVDVPAGVPGISYRDTR
jgi:hypothetical protein